MKILYPLIDGEISGGNMIALRIIEEALKRDYEIVVNSPTEGKFTDIIREKGIKVYNIDTRRSFRFDSALKLASIIKKENINLVHSHAPLGGAILSCLGGWIAGVPVITHGHSVYFLNKNPFVRNFQLLLNWVTSRIFCAKVIAVSEVIKGGLIKQGIAANKITVVYNGINLDNTRFSKSYLEIRKEFSLERNQQIIGEVGRLSKFKGQHILIGAAQKVIKNNPDAVFMIVGEDLGKGEDYKRELTQLTTDLGLMHKIIFTGYRPDIINLMNAFNLFVLPSLVVEGLPVVILEAMAAKKPVITTPVGGNLEVVIDGETGTIIPPNDADRLAQAIIQHLENPESSKKMGEKGYERVKQYFSLSQMTDKIMDIYKETLVDFDYEG